MSQTTLDRLEAERQAEAAELSRPNTSTDGCSVTKAAPPNTDESKQYILTPEEDTADSIGSFHAAIDAIGERVKAGEPVPTTGYFERKRGEG